MRESARGDARDIAARRHFVTRAVLHQGTVGAIAPSSRHLARLLTSIVPRSGQPVVVELGAGTGAVSDEITRVLPAGGRQLAIEIDPGMVRFLRRHRPGLTVIPGDAAQLAAHIAEHGVTQIDALVSGLPWALFTESTQRAIVRAASIELGATGAFSTFAYLHGLGLPGARRLKRMLHEHFEEVITTAPVWRNLPPARVYVCRRPTPPS